MVQRRSAPAIGRLLALTLALLASGCSSVPLTSQELDEQAKAFRPVDGLSTIYLFRDEHLGGVAPIAVSLDGQVAGQTSAWTYIRWILPPGTHRLASYADNVDELEIVTEPGELYFVRHDVKLGLFHPRAELRLVDEERGRRGVLASRRVADLLSAPME